LIAVGIVAPAGAAYAFDLDAMIEAAKNGNGTYVETHSSASTGGQTAKSGESVQTGDAGASSYTEIHANGEGGTVKVNVETTENGTTNTKEYTQQIPKGEGVKVEANAESKDGESDAEVNVNGEVVDSEIQTASALVAFNEKISLLFTEKIPSFFKKLFSFFT
jgi:hypothetical protein